MDHNKQTKSKAVIITIIVILLLLVAGFFLLKSKSQTSTSNFMARIFSSLNPSGNSKNINTGDEKKLAQAGEDLKKGDKVYVTSTTTDNNPVVMKIKSQSDTVFGIATNDIENGEIGEITLSNGNGWGVFWDSIVEVVGNTFSGGNSGNDITIDPNGGDPWDPNGNDPVDPNEIPECRDTIDNDSDSFIDINDPDCHLGGILTNPYIPNYDSESTAPNPSDLKECNDTIDNDNDNFIDIDDPQCHIGGDLNNQYVPTHDSESNNPGEESGLPDLTAGPVSPTFAGINSPIVLSSTITNLGVQGTGVGFSSFFTIKSIGELNGNSSNPISTSPIKKFISNIFKKISYVSKVFAAEDKEIIVQNPTIMAKAGLPATITYTFTSSGLYQVRLCADKKSVDDIGIIQESNEDNNCGPWTTITISNSLPTGGDTGGEITITPFECSDKLDNDEDKLIDELDPQCHIGGDITKEYLPNHYSERISQEDPNADDQNMCLLIEQNPLVFTGDEEAELAQLLRKFYLIAPTLKTEDDINMEYTQLVDHENFKEQLDVLLNECYAQSIDKNGVINPKYQGPTTRFGNPWYKYDQRGSYINDTIPGCFGNKVREGSNAGQLCSSINNPRECEVSFGFPPTLTGCTWIDYKEMELLLNIW